MTKFQGILGDG
uniref:Uncharacterized protein n=1 Tax=Anguilla anguilla TaxID=7936 RepID=A0A0E9VNX9_ANGAN